MNPSSENKSHLLVLSDVNDVAAEQSKIFESMTKLLIQGGSYAPVLGSVHDFVMKSLSPFEPKGERFLTMLWLGSGGETVGFSMIRLFDDTADLDYVVVEKSLRQNGTGSAFMLGMMKELKAFGAKRMLLEVGVENVPALALYRKLGFKEISRRKGYYRSGEDAIVMEFFL
jgi:ribosomal protein S18 acetylase RimI-like enzyme